jgi:two-component system sensor histidine kinase TctE
MKNSIRRQMQVWLMTPLLILLIVSAVCSYVLSMYLSREAYDKTLLNSMDSLASRLIFKGDTVEVEKLPKRTQTLLTHENRDEFLYEVFTPDGKLLTKDQGLPKPPVAIPAGEMAGMKYEVIGNKVFRVAATKVCLPEAASGALIVQAAETLNSRKEYRRKLLLGIVIPQMILLSLAVLAVWISIEKGIKPLRTISELVRRRAPTDLSPIHEEHAPSEVKSFLTALNGLFMRISADVEKQHRFAANAAHQLRTPLAGLKTYIELLEKNSKDPEQDKMLNQMNDGVDRIIRTVQQLLSLSRAEQNDALLQSYDIIDLNCVAENALTDAVPESIRLNIEVDLDTPDHPTHIRGDAISLKELTTNLIENAIKYNSPGGHVSVSVTNGETVELSVEDDGLGIPVEERSKVFERFYRMEKAINLDVSGSGLGLSIVSEIARIHGATINLESGKGNKGSKFTVVFPKVPPSVLVETAGLSGAQKANVKQNNHNGSNGNGTSGKTTDAHGKNEQAEVKSSKENTYEL